ncbi:carboxymuconolactone decarboxylase family protein [Kitasatospora sp. NPDC101235]|uniref:carboxymuconolactone decarboxylase family protein n=1 Tax=Kitasatospora sp. NPDC101235 TaxID=3364101 RepID=UPI003809C9D8
MALRLVRCGVPALVVVGGGHLQRCAGVGALAAALTLADLNKVPTEVTDAVRDGKPVPDERLAALAAFTEAFVQTRALPSAAHVADFLRAGFTETDILQILLAVSVRTISNYTNHLFHTPVDPAFARRAWQD